MKKQLLISVLLIFITGAVSAQAQTSFAKGDNLFNIGVGVGSPFFGSGYSSSLPINPAASFERGILDFLSVGAQVSFASSKFNYSGYGSSYSYKETAVYLGVRGAYHFNQLIELDSKLDLYGGASAGYVIVTLSDNQGYSGSAAGEAGVGAFAGARYYFKPGIGVYAEVGYQSLSLASAGVAFKF